MNKLISCIAVVGILSGNTFAYESKNRSSIGVTVDYHGLNFNDYKNMKNDTADNLLARMLLISQLGRASSYEYSRRLTYPTALANTGITAHFTFPSNFILSLRFFQSAVGSNDYLHYRDNLNNYIDIVYDWKIKTSDIGGGVGYRFNNAFGNHAALILQLMAGSYDVQYTEKGTRVVDVRPSGGTAINVSADYDKSYSKIYFEPGISAPIHFTRSGDGIIITPKVGYIFIPSEDVRSYNFDFSGVKIGLAVDYQW